MGCCKNIILFGAPGAGKGTQGEILKNKLDVPAISMGDIFRKISKQKDDLSEEVKAYINSGKLVPDEITAKVLKNRILEKDCEDGFILDGYPRNLSQAKILDDLQVRIDKFIYIELSEEEILSRLGGRRICSECGEVYHVKFKKPKIEGKCNFCGSDLVLRQDDKKEVIEERLKVFNSELELLKKYYLDRGKFLLVNGEDEIENVTNSLLEVVGV